MCFKQSSRVFILIVCLPLLISSKSIENTLNTIESSEKSKEIIRCEFYDATSPCVKEAQEKGIDAAKCSEIKECPNQYCYTVWKNQTENQNETKSTNSHPSGFDVKRMGCLASDHDDTCSTSDTCLDTKSAEERDDSGHGHFFCCCKGDLCNGNFEAVQHEAIMQSTIQKPPKKKENDQWSPVVVIILIFLLVVFISLGAVVIFCFHYRKKVETPSTIDPASQALISPHNLPQSLSGITQHQEDNVQLIQIIGKGKYGNVWKAKKNSENSEIAVKTFHLQSKKSWEDEKNIYNIPHMENHPNILKFLFVCERGDNINKEFWLATELQVGCLHTHLKENTVNWDEMYKIALSMMEGLTFLHEECPPKGSTSGHKPAIAHRDFKSKNVLIKRDMSACIADFGLAMELENIGDTHGQVGTIRYMAPEVLEGAINFSRDAFLRIDMYACALVLWELASRCRMTENLQVFDYKLPFETEEEEQNKMPNALSTMQDLVVNQKLKPKIQDSWRTEQKTKILCNTIEECWDQDAEARLSASCVVERMKCEMGSFLSNHNVHQIQNERNTMDSGVSVGGSENSEGTDNVNTSDEIPMSDLSQPPQRFGQT